jgi:hypothetical protein
MAIIKEKRKFNYLMMVVLIVMAAGLVFIRLY